MNFEILICVLSIFKSRVMEAQAGAEGAAERRGRQSWTSQEDNLLRQLVAQHGDNNWTIVSTALACGFSANRCRSRYKEQLDPNLYHGPWTETEERVLAEAQTKLGNQWSEIAKLLPRRSSLAISNHWHSAQRRGAARGRPGEREGAEGLLAEAAPPAGGEWSEKVTHTYADGRRYDGEWNDDKAHGRGTLTWADGRRYHGEWSEDKMHGRGTYTWPDGGRYDGECRADKRHGRGTQTWADGGRYDGEWSEGNRHGFGTLTYARLSVVKPQQIQEDRDTPYRDSPFPPGRGWP